MYRSLLDDSRLLQLHVFKPLRRRILVVQLGKGTAHPCHQFVPVASAVLLKIPTFAAKQCNHLFRRALLFGRHVSVSVWNECPVSFVHKNVQTLLFFVRSLIVFCLLRNRVYSSGGAPAAADGCPSFDGLGVFGFICLPADGCPSLHPSFLRTLSGV